MQTDLLSRQLSAIRTYAKRRGWKVVVEAQEIGSGAKTRPKREEILKAAAGATSMPSWCGASIGGAVLCLI